MPIDFKILFVFMAMLLNRGIAFTQIPVEIFAANKKTTFDLLFFRFLKTKLEIIRNFYFLIEIEPVLII